jgi:hypothetical protein
LHFAQVHLEARPIGDDVDVGRIAQELVDRLGRAFESADKQDFLDLFWDEGW